MLIRRVARPMLAAAFVSQGLESLRNPVVASEAARPAVEGLRKLPVSVGKSFPADPETVARVAAAAQVGGGVLLATGKLPRLAAAALAVAILPASLGAHVFWGEADPVRKARKRRDFMVDVSLLGGLIIASADTAGKPSLAWRGRRTAHRVARTASAGLSPAGAGVAVGGLAERGGQILDGARSAVRRLAQR